MKKEYISPEFELLFIEDNDIITNSNTDTEEETFRVNPDGSVDFPTIPFG